MQKTKSVFCFAESYNISNGKNQPFFVYSKEQFSK